MLEVKSGVDGVTGWDLGCILNVGVCGGGNRVLGCSGVPASAALPVFLINIGYFEFFLFCYDNNFTYFTYNF